MTSLNACHAAQESQADFFRRADAVLAALQPPAPAGSGVLKTLVFWTFLLLCIGGIVALSAILVCQTNVV